MRSWGLAILVWAGAVAATPPAAYGAERMAAIQETLVCIDDSAPSPAVLTYAHGPHGYCQLIGLGHASVLVGQPLRPISGLVGLHARNLPEGVELLGTLGPGEVRVRLVPLLDGRAGPAWEGAAVLSVTTSPPVPVRVEFGGMGRTCAWPDGSGVPTRAEWLRASLDGPPQAGPRLLGGCAIFSRAGIEPRVAVRTTGEAAVEGGVAVFDAPTGQAVVTVAFAESPDRAVALACQDAARGLATAERNARRLVERASISTPEPAIDQAFSSALLNLEYSWVRPYGWVEAINHWEALWHMQHGPAADCIGQTDRAGECILAAVDHQLPSGRIPQFMPDGATRVDFGGSEQFFTWQVQHHWRYTGDREFAGRVYPALSRAVAAVERLYDPDGNGLWGWGQQIANQEDYISTPGDGASPTFAAIEMQRTLAELAEGLGRTEEAARHRARADEMAALLRERLWMPEYGRFAFYRDGQGVLHRQGQYHTLLQPALFGLVDPLDAYTGVEHLADTLVGPSGEVYASDNFPRHVLATVGSQAGAAQQPWAAWALARVGRADEGIRALRWLAGRVVQPPNAGSWPEVYGTDASYFSPPAGVYIHAVVEGIFGVERDVPAGVVRVRPGMPEGWPHAAIRLPSLAAAYAQSAGRRSVELTLGRPLALDLEWALPPCRIDSVRVGGKPATFSTRPAVAGVSLLLHAAQSRHFDVAIGFHECGASVEFPPRVAEGDLLQVRASGCRPVVVVDREQLLSEVSIGDGRVTARLRRGLLSDARAFGAEGIAEYSRRTFFVRVAAGPAEWFVPIHFEVAPDVQVVPTGPAEADGTVSLEVRNGSESPLPGPLDVRWAGARTSWEGTVPPHGSATIRFTPPRPYLALLSPGTCEAVVCLPDGRTVAADVRVAAPFGAGAALRPAVTSRARPIPLPDELLQPDTDWRSWRVWGAYGHMPWAASRPPMESLVGRAELEVPELPGVTFSLPGRRVAVASADTGRPLLSIPVNAALRKVYFLLLPLLDNHDVHSPVARVRADCEDGVTVARTLYFPGDLDWWCPREVVGDFATADSGWTRSIGVRTPSAVFNVIELDLGAVREVRRLVVESLSEQPAIGVVAVSRLGPLDASLLPEDLRPPTALRDPVVVADFEDGTLGKWRTEGDAWAVGRSRGDRWGRQGQGECFADSLAKGEDRVGTLTSPPFRVTMPTLSFLANGWGPPNYFALVDAATGRTLRRAPAPDRTGRFVEIRWDVADLMGTDVVFEAVDAESKPAWAWIAFDRLTLSP